MQQENKNDSVQLSSRYQQYMFAIGHLRGTSRPEVFPIGEESEKDTRRVGEEVSYCLDANYAKGTNTIKKGRRQIVQLNKPVHSNDRVYSEEGLSPTLNTMQGGNRQPFIKGESKIRRLTPKECERLQGLPDGHTEFGIDTCYHIRYNKDSNNIKKLDLCKQTTVKKLNSKNAQWKIVKENKLPISVTALCTIKDIKEQGQQRLLKEILKGIKSVSIAIVKSEKLEQWECVINITKCGDSMGTHFTWKINAVNQEVVGTLETGQENQSTELLWKNISEESLLQMKYHTTLTGLRPIIESVIYTFVQGLNMQLSINNLTVSSQNQLAVNVLSLRTESIVKESDSARYKMCGNAVTVNVVKEIIKSLIV